MYQPGPQSTSTREPARRDPGYELCVTEKRRLWFLAAEVGFLCCVARLSLRAGVRSSSIQEELGVELLSVERNQLRWLGLLVLVPPGRLSGRYSGLAPPERGPGSTAFKPVSACFLCVPTVVAHLNTKLRLRLCCVLMA